MSTKTKSAAHHQLEQLELAAEAMTTRQIIKALRGHLVSVAEDGDDTFIIFQAGRSRKGLAHILAQWQLVEQLHIATDKENGSN